jgi:DNA helicase-2/ATP-dependent DNA helicase PcrA
MFHLKHVPKSKDPEKRPGPFERARDKAVDTVKDYVGSFGGDFARRRQVEARFEIPVEKAVISGSIDLLLKEDAEGRILEAEVVDFKSIEGGNSPTQNIGIDWTELALQVQLYALAAKEVLGENAQTGSVHFLKDNQRIQVPIDAKALKAAVSNAEWAVEGILAGDFPMRPHKEKCQECDFNALCPMKAEPFQSGTDTPPAIMIPAPEKAQHVQAFSRFSARFKAR